jgi:hypothetical protein
MNTPQVPWPAAVVSPHPPSYLFGGEGILRISKCILRSSTLPVYSRLRIQFGLLKKIQDELHLLAEASWIRCDLAIFSDMPKFIRCKPSKYIINVMVFASFHQTRLIGSPKKENQSEISS